MNTVSKAKVISSVSKTSKALPSAASISPCSAVETTSPRRESSMARIMTI